MKRDTAEISALLQWWHQQQLQARRTEADSIRNGLMQEVFAMRRQLEVAVQPAAKDVSAVTASRVHLAELERIYSALEEISNRLDFPFSQDSLPLALRHRLKPWQRSLQINMDFSHDWPDEPTVHTQLLLFLTSSLCQRLNAIDPLPQSCHLKMHQQNNLKTIAFCAHYPDRLPPQLPHEAVSMLAPAVQAFKILTRGDYRQTLSPAAQPAKITWTLRWSERD